MHNYHCRSLLPPRIYQPLRTATARQCASAEALCRGLVSLCGRVSKEDVVQYHPISPISHLDKVRWNANAFYCSTLDSILALHATQAYQVWPICVWTEGNGDVLGEHYVTKKQQQLSDSHGRYVGHQRWCIRIDQLRQLGGVGKQITDDAHPRRSFLNDEICHGGVISITGALAR